MEHELRILGIWTVIGAAWLVLHAVVLVRVWPVTPTLRKKIANVLIPFLPLWTLWKNQRRVLVILWMLVGSSYLALRLAYI